MRQDFSAWLARNKPDQGRAALVGCAFGDVIFVFDEFLDLPIRADHIFWFATANSLEPLADSIVDRLIVFTIAPKPAEMLAIQKSLFHEANLRVGQSFAEPAAALFEALASTNPEVQVAVNGIDLARAERERTYQDRLPDFAVGVTNNRPDEGKASWDVMFEVMIPLQQSSRRAREREAEYLKNLKAQSMLEGKRLKFRGEPSGGGYGSPEAGSPPLTAVVRLINDNRYYLND